MDELKERYDNLSDKEKVAFVKKIMPEVCQIVKDNPEQMQELMSSCMGMMDMENMDMMQMMKMMGKMQD